MASSTSTSSGFMGSLRALGESLLASAQDRIELFALELQEEKFRLIQTFIWISAVIFTGMMAAAFASLTLVYLLWQTAPLTTLVGLTVFYSLSLAAAVWRLRYHIARQPLPFAASLEELGADRSCIRNPN
jgi:uncharacterized membrane protein YqjE